MDMILYGFYLSPKFEVILTYVNQFGSAQNLRFCFFGISGNFESRDSLGISLESGLGFHVWFAERIRRNALLFEALSFIY